MARMPCSGGIHRPSLNPTIPPRPARDTACKNLGICHYACPFLNANLKSCEPSRLPPSITSATESELYKISKNGIFQADSHSPLVGARCFYSSRIGLGRIPSRIQNSPLYSSAGCQNPRNDYRGKVPRRRVQTLALRQRLPGSLDHPHRGCGPRPRPCRRWLDTASHRRSRTVHLSALYRGRWPPIYGSLSG